MDEKLYSYMVILVAAAAFFYFAIVFLGQCKETGRLKKKYGKASGEMGKYIRKQSAKCIWLALLEITLAAVAVIFKVMF